LASYADLRVDVCREETAAVVDDDGLEDVREPVCGAAEAGDTATPTPTAKTRAEALTRF
jgi:hypothetical protein